MRGLRFTYQLPLAILLLAGTTPLGTTPAADWPMWRNDGLRSGASPSALPSRLHLHWTRQLPPPQPAWPNEGRLHFDTSYEPVVLGSRMFVGSMVDGSMTAISCETGGILWRFYANGPIRLAPVAREGRVYFGSDDGWLYCLAAEDGQLLWKVSGAPENRDRYRHLGNARLVSFWPVRGGPVLADEVVYFGAGIWPTLGVFVRAVDAMTGDVLWTNDDSHAIENVRVDHNYLQESGISPQGHMLVRGDMLIVPNGRSMPARIDRQTGKLHYFVQGYRNGDSRVIVSGDLALVGRTGVVSLRDGREIASRWVEAGSDAPAGWSSPQVDLFEGPLFAYKFLPGCDHRSVIDDGIAYGIEDGVVYAYDLRQAATSLQDQQFNGNDIQPARWDAPLRWKLKTPLAGRKLPTNTLIKAGPRLYGHCGRTLFAVELAADPAAPGKLVWQRELPAEPTSLLAAADRLTVVTNDGLIQSFGRGEVNPIQNHPLDQFAAPRPPTPAAIPPQVRAEWILDAVPDAGGYALVLGLQNGELVNALLTQTECHVIVVDSDRQLVNQLRQTYGTDERFTSRFQGLVDDPAEARLPPYIASLIVTENPEKLQLATRSQLRQIYESLRPYGGTLCLPLAAGKRVTNLEEITPQDFPGVTMQTTEHLLVLQRTGALPGSSIWSHETGDAARSFFSNDDLVRAPLAVLWYGDGRDHGFAKRKDYGHGLKPQVAGGRLFALQVATNTLKSVDAYTGRLLWSRQLGSSARYASLPDAVYVADERTCLVLDPASGKTQQTFPLKIDLPAESPVSATDIRVSDEIILIAVRFNKQNAIEKGRWNSQLLIVLDRKSGRLLWRRPATFRYNTAAIAVAGGRVYCIDSHGQEEIGFKRRRGEDVDQLPSTILALDARSGREVWKTVRHDPPAKLSSLHFMGLRTQDDWLAIATKHNLVLGGKADRTFALNADSGAEVWQKPVRGQQPLILGPETFINQSGHTYEVGTGNLLSGSALFRRGGCNYAVGGKNLLFLRSNCATYVDIESRQEYAIRNLRSGCSNSLVAADGLLNAPCFSVGCVCNYPIQTSFAMFHMPESASWHGDRPRQQEVTVD